MTLQDEKKMVLEMVSESKITIQEAEELLDALEDSLHRGDHFITTKGFNLVGNYRTSGCSCDCGDDIDMHFDGIGDRIGKAIDLEVVLDDLDFEMYDLDSEMDDLDATLEDLEADLDDIEDEFEI